MRRGITTAAYSLFRVSESVPQGRPRWALGEKVRLEHSQKGGHGVIRFYGDEDLDALLDRLSAPPASWRAPPS